MADNHDKRKNKGNDMPEQPPASKGEMLKAERLKKGLTLEVVHEETKIPLDALKAIEEGYTIRKLSDFYYRGFLKIYAKYLDIDVSKVVEKKPRTVVKSPTDEPQDEVDIEEWLARIFTPQTKQYLIIGAGMLVALFLLFQGVRFLIGLFQDRPPAPRTHITDPKPAGTPASTAGASSGDGAADAVAGGNETLTELANAKQGEDEASPAPDASSTSPAPAAPTQSPSDATPSPAGSETATQAQAVKDVTLTVRATKDSWLRVMVDGNVAFQSTLKLGSVETWFADEEIVISGRNISYLEFELNGKMIGKLGRRNRKVKKVVITEDGLQVSP
jgi:cytoskeletal protein RodZ